MAPKINPFLTRYNSLEQHFRNFIKHSSSEKIRNMMINEFELRNKKTILSSSPIFMKVESTPNCNLKCPQCEHGKAEFKNKGNGNRFMSLDNFKKIIDPFADKIFFVSLSHRGEPLLNPHLFQIIAYCHEKNIGTEFPTSFSVALSQKKIEQLITCGLDHIIISIDGITQDVYEEYRRGGDLNLVLKNVSTLISLKNRLSSKTPFVEFKFIRFDHNYHQLEAAEKLSREMCFDKFTVVLDNASSAKYEIMKSIKAKNLIKKKPCFWPWNCMVVYWDGTVSPCCARQFNMGNAFETSINSIWNNDKYQELRSSFTEQKLNEWQFCLQNCWPR